MTQTTESPRNPGRFSLDYCNDLTSLHDINVRILAFVDQHYNRAPHSSLMGRSPQSVWLEEFEQRPTDNIDERALRDALTVRKNRRVRRDTTIAIGGRDYELDQGFLAGRVVTAVWCMLDDPLKPWVEYQDKRYELRPVDVLANATRKRPPRTPTPTPTSKTPPDFDPPRALLDELTGRSRKHQEKCS